MNCKKCNQFCIKNGRTKSGEQRYFCILCKKSFQSKYIYQACKPQVNSKIIALLKEGCGIRSISRLLGISPTTTLKRILAISSKIKSPLITMGKVYEVDELCTYIGNKNRKRWIAYSLRKDTGEVINFVVGTRTKRILGQVINTLLLSEAKMIYTDKLNIYKSLIPKNIHCTRQYSINHIERNNLTLRTHLKRLNRKTICYSKSILMLTAILKIYFWANA